MIYQKQTIFTDMANVGNCFQAVLATMLEMDMRHVPHFYEDADPADVQESSVETTEMAIDNWLRSFGVLRFKALVRGETFKEAMHNAAAMSPTGYAAILSGMTKRNTSHAVIVRDGEMVWDPHPSEDGLALPYDGGIWMIEWLAKPVDFKWQ
jgi:hypothetical protein